MEKRLKLQLLILLGIMAIALNVVAVGAQGTLGSPPDVPTPTAVVPTPTVVVPTPTVVVPTLPPTPGKPVPVSPRGWGNPSRSQTFYWDPAANTETYTVYWSSDNGDSGELSLSASDGSCTSGRCAISTTLPFEGEYKWYVIARNAAGSTQSDTMEFTLNSNISTPDAFSPSGTIYDNRATTFVFTDVRDNVYQYRIRVIHAGTGQVMLDRYWNVDQMTCENYRCYVTTNTFLPAGNYIWRVRGYSNNSVSNWSNEVSFYMYCTTCNYSGGSTTPAATATPGTVTNTVPTPISPAGNIVETTPVFSWRTLTGAELYWISISDSSNKVIYSGTVNNSACTYESCTFSPGFTLPGGGNYSWKVSGGSAAGVTWGSATTSFTLTEAPKAVTFLIPEENGNIGSEGSAIVWSDPGQAIESFKVAIFDNNNEVLLDTVMDRETLWCSETGCMLEFSSIPLGEGYRIEVTPVSTYGAEGSAASLTFNVVDEIFGIETLYPKDGSIVQSRPLFRWQLPEGAAADSGYVLRVTDEEGKNAEIGPLVCETDGLTCADGQAFFIPADSLPAGTYTWTVELPDLELVSEAIKMIVE